nr:uncharacterized protein LOC109150044 [Ipomoea batatas]
MGKMESQRSVFDSLGSNPKAPKRKAIHDRLEVVQDVKNNASHLVKRNLLKGFEKGENEESVGSGDDVVPPQDEEASSFHITLCDETPIEGEDAEDEPHELEEGVRAAIDELKEATVAVATIGTPTSILPRRVRRRPTAETVRETTKTRRSNVLKRPYGACFFSYDGGPWPAVKRCEGVEQVLDDIPQWSSPTLMPSGNGESNINAQ